jgi:hypothetical protein
MAPSSGCGWAARGCVDVAMACCLALWWFEGDEWHDVGTRLLHLRSNARERKEGYQTHRVGRGGEVSPGVAEQEW